MEVPFSDGALSELPEEIVAKIQARLTLVSLMKSRAVCRAWKAAVDSPSRLLQERLEWRGGAREHMLVVAGFRLGQSKSESGPAEALLSCAYDPGSDRWCKLQLGRGLPPELAQEQEKETAFVELPPASTPAGVLVARVCSDPEERRQRVRAVHIGNPVAGSWASLPEFPPWLGMGHMRGVLVDALGRCFKVVVVGHTKKRLRSHPFRIPTPVVPVSTFVFDSARGMWSVTSRVMPWGDDFDGKAGQGVFVGTVLYCLTLSCNLLAYDVERAIWTRLFVDKPKDVILPGCAGYGWICSDFHLFSVRDRLLCTARKHEVRHYVWQIWEMDFAAMAWTVVDSMPAPINIQFRLDPGDYESWYNRCSVVAGQQEVYIMREMRGNKVKIVAVDFRHTPPAWRLLPPLPDNSFTNSFTKRILHCFDPWLQFGSGAQH